VNGIGPVVPTTSCSATSRNASKSTAQLANEYPADNAGHHQLAVCYSELRNIPKAVEEARKAADLYPKDALERRNLALFLAYASDFEAAEREARATLQINPNYAKGYLTLAYAQLGQGQINQAIDTYRQLEKTGKLGASFAASGLADLDIYEGRFSNAVRTLDSAVAGDKATTDLLGPEKLVALAYAQLSRGEKALAVQAASRALALSKKANIRFMVARTYIENGDAARAHAIANRSRDGYSPRTTGLFQVDRRRDRAAVRQSTTGD
jgi:tetratricopeptide (TPR) repeat protein